MSTNCCRVDGVSTSEAPEEPPRRDEDERAAWLSLAGVMTLLPAALDAQLQRDAVRATSSTSSPTRAQRAHLRTIGGRITDHVNAGPSPHRATAAGPRGCLRTASIR